jgi:ParB family chromosome partitioning protein
MAAKGNRGFADSIAPDETRATASRLPPRTGILSGRENRLAALASGSAVSRLQELVDPARCRIWEHHNRDYAALSETVCRDLVDSLRAQGRQEVPAIVRRVPGDPSHDYEVICGARRHWSVTWLRAHGYPDFRFLIEPRELSDEEAFRISDLENRSRKDLSDYERAVDYARAVSSYYNGNQGRMAERLQVSQSWLSRYLELARLPAEVIAAFGAPHALGISHAARLAPLLRAPASRGRLLTISEALAASQRERREAGDPPLSAAEVMKQLTAKPRPGARPKMSFDHKDEQGRTMLQVDQGRGGGVTLFVPKPGLHDRRELLKAIDAALARLAG